MQAASTKQARSVRVTGIVQGVGFRPLVYRLAQQFGVSGWVLNAGSGVEIHAEASRDALDEFVREIAAHPPPAAHIADIAQTEAPLCNFGDFSIRASAHAGSPTVRVSPDLPVCEACLAEMRDPRDRRYRYPYINCTNCGPRYSIVLGLPYDRPQTTMGSWPMCAQCAREYDDPGDRRFHAQPVACPACGPRYFLVLGAQRVEGHAAIERAAGMLAQGKIVAIKGIGGYHLACDAANGTAVNALRERKYRKERPFAVMVRDIDAARQIASVDGAAQTLLASPARPIVLLEARVNFPGVAPGNGDLGIMLAYAPLHHLLFDAGAPDVVVMTSANRSSEPIAYEDGEALRTLSGIADAFLIGERAIARRVDDSLAAPAPVVLRHARGYAPRAVAVLPSVKPILALGADLKNAIALVVHGQAFVSQHIGDLEHFEAALAFRGTIDDLCALYEVAQNDLTVAHDAHPQYNSSAYAQTFSGTKVAVQHHRAHVASVLAERGALHQCVLGFAFDGTGYGEDGCIWGGEVFLGNLKTGLQRVAHLREVPLPGGDAAARFPVQAAAGFLYELPEESQHFLDLLHRCDGGGAGRYAQACDLIDKNVRVFRATSMGRLFDTVAALLGFTRPITFEAQAAMWLEHLARQSALVAPYAFPFVDGELDFRPLLQQIVADLKRNRNVTQIARAFHEALAQAMLAVCAAFEQEYVVASGGVFQNQLLTGRLVDSLSERLWINHVVPPNDGGICLGQAAIASLQ